MIIKNIEEFENINEELVSSFLKGIKKAFISRESQLRSILEKIKEAKEEDIDNRIQIEKEIKGLANENTPESRFLITNLNRQLRTFSSLKEQEVSSLIKEAHSIIKEDPKLKAFFYSELSKIEISVMEKYIKNIKQYKDISFIDALSKEFEDLVKDADKKANIYKKYQDKEEYFPGENIIRNIDQEIIRFIELTTQEANIQIRMYSNEQLEKIHQELKKIIFNLEIEYQKSIDAIRKDIKNAQEENQSWLVSSLENQEKKLKYYMKRLIDKIKYKNLLVKKELNLRNMFIKKINNPVLFEQKAKNTQAEKIKNAQAKADIEKQMLEINKRISEIDLAIANLIKREKEGSLSKSESYKQQGIELQKKAQEYQKKSQIYSKMEELEK